MNFDEVMEAKKPHTQEVPIVLDSEWAERLQEAQQALVQAEGSLKLRETVLESLRQLDDPEALRETTDQIREGIVERDAAQAKVDELRAQSATKMITFKLRGLAPFEVDDLIADHQPTPEQKAEAKKNGAAPPRWNAETYAPAMVHAALVEPEWTVEQISAMWSSTKWNIAELTALYNAADGSTMSRRVVELGEG